MFDFSATRRPSVLTLWCCTPARWRRWTPASRSAWEGTESAPKGTWTDSCTLLLLPAFISCTVWSNLCIPLGCIRSVAALKNQGLAALHVFIFFWNRILEFAFCSPETAKGVLCYILKCYHGKTCKVDAKKLYIANSSLDGKSKAWLGMQGGWIADLFCHLFCMH